MRIVSDVVTRVILTGEKRNAFTPTLVEELLKTPCDGPIVFINEGPVFSAGLDLSVFLQDREVVLQYLFKIHDFVKKLLSCRGRLFAVVAGDVYGFGVEFLYFVDYVVAVRGDLKFSLQGVNFGVFPPYTSSIGEYLFAPAHIRTMFMREFTAEEARYIGLVSEIGHFDYKKFFSPPDYVWELVNRRARLAEVVDRAVPYLYKLAEVGTRPETREKIRQFLRKS
ncbi:MAG: enoyl-CoA hydratase/isomerase family protein [Pyrobaculum sp.]